MLTPKESLMALRACGALTGSTAMSEACLTVDLEACGTSQLCPCTAV